MNKSATRQGVKLLATAFVAMSLLAAPSIANAAPVVHVVHQAKAKVACYPKSSSDYFWNCTFPYIFNPLPVSKPARCCY
jgi:hypothetical protein